MANPFRTFVFERETPMHEALSAIRAGLDDEGLALGPRGTAADMVTSVIVDGRKSFRVPLSRIMAREDAQAYYAALPPRHAFVPTAEGSRTCAAPCGQDRGHPVHRLREEAAT